MTNGEHSVRSAMSNFTSSLIKTLINFARFTVETLIGVGVFGVLILASRAIRWLNVESGILVVEEYTWILKLIELILFAIGIVLTVMFIVKNSIVYGKDLLSGITEAFHQKPHGNGGTQ